MNLNQVRNRKPTDDRDHDRDRCILKRANEVAVVVPDRVPVIAPLPREGVAEVDRARLERLVAEEAQRDEEEDGEPEQPRRQEQVRPQPSMTMKEAHATRRSGSATPSGTSGGW